MKIKLTLEEKSVLDEIITRCNKTNIIERVEGSDVYCIIYITEENADRLRDECASYLQEVGFDEKYLPTKKGNILETLIDKLFID